MMDENVFQQGIKAGAMLRSLLQPEPGMVIAHRVPGRRRYVCQALKGESEVCEHVVTALAAYRGVTSVKASPLTGSVTVTYTASEREIDQLFDALSHLIAGRHAIHEKSLIPSTVLTVGDNINDGARILRAKAASFLNREEPLFLSRLIGLALVSCGLYRIVGLGDRPAGPQLFWWGLALLLRQSHRHPHELIAGAARMLQGGDQKQA